MKKLFLILILTSITSCNRNRIEQKTSKEDLEKVFHMNHLFSNKIIQTYFTDSKTDLKKFTEDNGIITYKYKQEFLSKKNKSRGGFYTTTYKFPYIVENNDFIKFVSDQTAELIDSKELDFRKTDKLKFNLTNYSTYEIFTDNIMFGYLILINKVNKIYSINFYFHPFIEPDFEILKERINKL